MLMARFITGKGMVVTEDHAQGKQLLQENPCYFTFKRYSNKFQHCFEMSQQRIFIDVPQDGSKATPDNSDEKKETGLCET